MIKVLVLLSVGFALGFIGRPFYESSVKDKIESLQKERVKIERQAKRLERFKKQTEQRTVRINQEIKTLKNQIQAKKLESSEEIGKLLQELENKKAKALAELKKLPESAEDPRPLIKKFREENVLPLRASIQKLRQKLNQEPKP